MRNILFILALVMVATSGVVYVASGMVQHGQHRAYEVCNLYSICDYMHWLFGATALVVALYFLVARADA
jgi:hypothetical protein